MKRCREGDSQWGTNRGFHPFLTWFVKICIISLRIRFWLVERNCDPIMMNRSASAVPSIELITTGNCVFTVCTLTINRNLKLANGPPSFNAVGLLCHWSGHGFHWFESGCSETKILCTSSYESINTEIEWSLSLEIPSRKFCWSAKKSEMKKSLDWISASHLLRDISPIREKTNVDYSLLLSVHFDYHRIEPVHQNHSEPLDEFVQFERSQLRVVGEIKSISLDSQNQSGFEVNKRIFMPTVISVIHRITIDRPRFNQWWKWKNIIGR